MALFSSKAPIKTPTCVQDLASVTEGGSVNIYFHTRPPLAPVHCRLYRVRCPAERLLVNRYCVYVYVWCVCASKRIVDYLFTEEERLSSCRVVSYRIVSLRRHSALSSHVPATSLCKWILNAKEATVDFSRPYTLNRIYGICTLLNSE